MKTEYLLMKMQEEKAMNDLFEYVENDNNWEQIDAFGEFLSGCTDTVVKILAAAMEQYYDMNDDLFLTEDIGNYKYVEDLAQIALKELTDRGLATWQQEGNK